MSGSDYDQDGDGFDSKEFTPDEAGTDCDDSDASITDDCGTGDDGGGVEEPAECGCTAGSRSGGGWLVLLALSGLVRRRRS
jgi:MYXO-CTERM domain-containing protein